MIPSPMNPILAISVHQQLFEGVAHQLRSL
jgi:hypothetical protein